MRETEWRTRFTNVLKYEAWSASVRGIFEERGDCGAFTLKNKGSTLVLSKNLIEKLFFFI